MRTSAIVSLLCAALYFTTAQAADEAIDSAECLVSLVHSHCAISPIEYNSPLYPERASTRGVTGWVRLGFTITAEGAVTDARVIAASPVGMFDTSSIRAIERYRFEPRIVNGIAVPVQDVQHVFRYIQ